MNQVVVNLMKCSGSSIIASNRIAVYLAQKLGCPLIDSKESIFQKHFDRLYFVNGPMLYCGFREELKEIVDLAKEVIWVSNDYAIGIPKFVKEKNPIVFSSCVSRWAGFAEQYVNWNQLTYYDSVPAQPVVHKGLAYYGAYRDDRAFYFKKYLTRSDLYPIHISSSRSGSVAFQEIVPKARYFDAKNLMGVLGSYEAALYIEDRFSHKVFCSPANRFYEALSAHTLQLFDESCLPTFEKAKIDVTPWAVKSPEEFAQKLSDSDRLRAAQMEALRRTNYRASLDEQFKNALKMIV